MAHIVMSHCHVTVGHMMKFFGILKPLMKMTSHITWEHRLMIFKAPQHVHIASPFLCSVGCDLLQFFPVHSSPRIYILLYMCRQFAFFSYAAFNSVLCLHTHKRSDDFVWFIFQPTSCCPSFSDFDSLLIKSLFTFSDYGLSFQIVTERPMASNASIEMATFKLKDFRYIPISACYLYEALSFLIISQDSSN